jgi:TRAP-type C4-dicarboxylate transport system permease small subunit
VKALKYLLTFRWANVTSELAGYLSAAALLLATFAMVHGVVSRYFLGRPTVWQTELSVYLLMFVTFVGAAYGLRHHAHVGVDLVVNRLPHRPQLIMRLVTAVLALGVVLVVFWTSAQMWWQAYQGGWRSSTAWGAPLYVVYAMLPLGMLLVAAQYLAFIVEGAMSLLGVAGRADPVALMQQQSPELAEVSEP